jgi:hypothetical protein
MIQAAPEMKTPARAGVFLPRLNAWAGGAEVATRGRFG